MSHDSEFSFMINQSQVTWQLQGLVIDPSILLATRQSCDSILMFMIGQSQVIWEWHPLLLAIVPALY